MGEAESITVTLRPDSLRRLLQQQELHVDEFSCWDDGSRERVRLMLLNIVGRR
ncbi:hypothetical protein [Marinobacter zhejiangensis]|uniref:Uncharacterized protein n=1 Tax=Marinobacter zhejiangensis TaxID=488535 RepID=A0A1I4NI11_9GAMM|nr:hypothetical protein [Marinobacter zhejiangensis]SFM15005.1 hypothetical protein SAMN04487963_1408 [Marinobacter zhejiangensis]